MLLPFSLAALSLLGTASVQSVYDSRLDKATDSMLKPPVEISIREIQPETNKEPRLICKGCSLNENRTLAFLQDKGITDRNALATIMGNIKQESTFIPNICEGGARTSYEGCRSGGYGLIQFTCESRYNGLGRHAYARRMNPSTLEAQLSYMVTEAQWKRIESRMKTPGKSIDRYMDYAYSWIGWGHHGARTAYAYNYANKLVPAS